MNYYKHHVGDYLKDTGGLTITQHGAYLLLLMAFYATEKPLPADEVNAIAKATSKPERDAVAKVLAKYWHLSPDGYVNNRALNEIIQDKKFIEKQRANGLASAAKRWGQPESNEPVTTVITTVTTKPQPPTPTPNTQTKKDSEKNTSAAKTPPIEPDWLPEFKMLYPKRGGDPNWHGAVKAAHARIAEGHHPAEFIDGARRYREFCEATNKINTEFVKQASTFLGPAKPFLEPWSKPATKAEVRLNGNLSAAEEFMRRTEQVQ